MPGQLSGTFRLVASGAVPVTHLLFLIVIMLAMVVSIIFMQQAHRKVPVQYTKRVVGNRVLGGQSSFLPLRLNQAGVIPIIFAISIIQLPNVFTTSIKGDGLSAFLSTLRLTVSSDGAQNFLDSVNHLFRPESGIIASVIYFGLCFFFTYFYTAVTFKPVDVADDLKKWGGFVPGIRPGRPTAEYLNNLMTRITLIGALFLGLIALAPFWVPSWTGIQTFSLVGGTSLLIVVGVALDTMQQLEAHLLMRQYEGFVR
jgi:preprotein translocase subunit SecY